MEPQTISPNDYIYKYLTRLSGPAAASGEDYDMNTNSSVGTPSIFSYSPLKNARISRINILILDDGIRYDRFAGISGALSNGCLFRVVDGNGGMKLDFLNGIPIINNADFTALAGVDAAGHQVAGDDLLPIRFSIFKGSQNKALFLRPTDRIEWHNQDNLSTITKFRIMVQGTYDKLGNPQ